MSERCLTSSQTSRPFSLPWGVCFRRWHPLRLAAAWKCAAAFPAFWGQVGELKGGCGEAGGCGWLIGRLEARLPRRPGWRSSNAGAEAPYDLSGGAGAAGDSGWRYDRDAFRRFCFRRLPGFEPGGGFLRSGVPFCRPVSGGARITSRVPPVLRQQTPVDADLENRNERPPVRLEWVAR